MRAFKMVDTEFVELVKSLAFSWYPARAIIKQAILDRFDVHPSGCILRIPGPSCPWKAHFFDLEKSFVEGVAENDSEISDFRHRPVFVITDRKTPNSLEFNVNAISCSSDLPFSQRLVWSAVSTILESYHSNSTWYSQMYL